MSRPAELEVDYLREKYPRAYKALVQLYPFEWDKMLRVVDEAVLAKKTASVILGKFSILRGLERTTRRWLMLSLAADRREVVVRRQRSFLTQLHDRSLDDILAELKTLEERTNGYTFPGAVPVLPNDGLPRDFSFISYHTKSQSSLALTLAQGLETRGLQCWVAPRDIRPGTNWNEQIYGATQRCSALVLLCCQAAASSKVVQGEVHIAVGRGIPVVVVLLEKIDPAAINVGLATYQHLDWAERHASDMTALVEQLTLALSSSSVLDQGIPPLLGRVSS
jgi:hypothetical protein